LTRRFDHDEVPEMRRKTHSQACARRKAISTQARMPRPRLAAGKTASDSNEIPQGPSELVGESCSIFVVVIGSERFNSSGNGSNRGHWNVLTDIVESKVFRTLQQSSLFS
jgi:hypothetical protein